MKLLFFPSLEEIPGTKEYEEYQKSKKGKIDWKPFFFIALFILCIYILTR